MHSASNSFSLALVVEPVCLGVATSASKFSCLREAPGGCVRRRAGGACEVFIVIELAKKSEIPKPYQMEQMTAQIKGVG